MGSHQRAFTLIELMAVVMILAILAGVALPKFFDYQTKSRESACKGALGGIRSGISNFYANEAVINGTGKYPTLAQLIAANSVMQEILPENPYDHSTGAVTFPNGVEDVTLANATASPRDIVNGGTNGWAYFEATLAGEVSIFYANTDFNDGTLDEHEF